MALVASEGGGCYLSVVCWLGYGLLLPAIAESSDRGGRRGADAGVEVVVKGPDGDVLGCELEPLPPSRICVWSTRLSRLRAPESRLRADRRCCRSGLFESASAVGAGTPTAGGTFWCCARSRKSTSCAGRSDHSADAPVAEPGQTELAGSNGGRPRPIATVRIGQAAGLHRVA